MHRERFYTLSASCPDRVGIVARVAGFIAEHKGWILESSYHADDAATRQRALLHAHRGQGRFAALPPRRVPRALPPDRRRMQMDWKISDSAVKKRVVVLVSKQEHCLYDLLARWQSKELDIEIPCVISNHDTFRASSSGTASPSITCRSIRTTRKRPTPRCSACSKKCAATPWCWRATCRSSRPICAPPTRASIINIHHSFLPSFVGAKPYHQAYSAASS
jgi:formyltetrahydrofolate deformylase